MNSDIRNALWLWNPKNHYWENTALSLPQTCAEVSARPKFDYPTSANVIRSGSHTGTSQNTPVALAVLLKYFQMLPVPPWSFAKCSQTVQEHSHVPPETTHSDGDAFRMLRDLNIRIVIFWNNGDLCAGQRGLGSRFSHQWFLGFHNHKAFHRIILIFVTVTRFAT